MAKAATLNIDIVAKAEQALSEFEKLKAKAKDTNATMKLAAVAAAGAILAGLSAATKAAVDHEAQVSKLAVAYKDAGVSTSGMDESLKQIEASSRRTGQSTEDNIAAFTKLIVATHNSAKAHSELAVAQDLAAFKGVNVSDATDAIIKANEGNTRALKAMGIQTTDTSGKQLSAAAIMEKLTAAVHGQANAFGDTAAGQMARYKESLDQAKVAVGEALLPVLVALMKALQPLFSWLQANQGVLRALAPVIAVVAIAVVGVTTALRVWTAVQVVLNAVLSANPIGLIIIGIAALVAGVIYAYTHFAWFRSIVQDVWGALQAVGAWIMGHWKLIVDYLLGPVGIILTNLGTVKRVIMDIVGALEAIGRAVSDAMGWLGKLASAGGGILGKISGGLSAIGLSAPGGGGMVQPLVIQVYATPGDDLPQVVYDALRRYQRTHVRPELRPLFG